MPIGISRFILTLIGIHQLSLAVLAQNCQLCPYGSYVTAPDNVILGSAEFASCEEMDLDIQTIPDDGSGMCELLDEIASEQGIDLKVYCKCSEYENPNVGVCEKVCSDQELANPQGDLFGIMTCQEYQDMLMAITDYSLCGDTSTSIGATASNQDIQDICCTASSVTSAGSTTASMEGGGTATSLNGGDAPSSTSLTGGDLASSLEDGSAGSMTTMHCAYLITIFGYVASAVVLFL